MDTVTHFLEWELRFATEFIERLYGVKITLDPTRLRHACAAFSDHFD